MVRSREPGPAAGVSTPTMTLRLNRRRVLVLLGLALVAGSTMFCSPGFVIRAGIEEARILSRRQPSTR
jgi:hypothetical protein